MGNEGNQNGRQDKFVWAAKARTIWATGKVRQFTGMGKQRMGKGRATMGGERGSIRKNWRGHEGLNSATG